MDIGEFSHGPVSTWASFEVAVSRRCRVLTWASLDFRSLDIGEFGRGRVWIWASLDMGEFRHGQLSTWASFDMGAF